MTARFRRFDWFIILAMFLFATMSSLTLFSSSTTYFFRHVILYAFAFAIVILGSQVEWRWLMRQSWFRYGLYLLSVLLLLFATFVPTVVRGTKSWIVIGDFQFEPSELLKLAIIILLAGFFSRRHLEAWRSRNILFSFFLMALPTAIVILQPDFGSAITLVVIWFSFLLMSGVNVRRLFAVVIAGFLILASLWFFVLEPYQKARITAFLFPSYDPLGVNYNVNQAKIAIGSAGFFGKGFGGGTQARLNFLPVAKTDFLFAAFIEEWGLLGGFVLLLTFLGFIYRLVLIGRRAEDNYSRFIVLGSISYLLIHFSINVGSNIGLLPVTGITLPLFSYGGSNLLTTSLLLAIIQHIKLESR